MNIAWWHRFSARTGRFGPVSDTSRYRTKLRETVMTADSKTQPAQPEPGAVAIRFARDKDTPGTIRYAEVVPDDDVAPCQEHLPAEVLREGTRPPGDHHRHVHGRHLTAGTRRGPGAVGTWPGVFRVTGAEAGPVTPGAGRNTQRKLTRPLKSLRGKITYLLPAVSRRPWTDG
jgi:hypothetical protein